jgi:hypothetical protein
VSLFGVLRSTPVDFCANSCIPGRLWVVNLEPRKERRRNCGIEQRVQEKGYVSGSGEIELGPGARADLFKVV